ncbi:DNA polymerase III subunit alpha [Neolewinella lacunae]|uniref:DNA-directed DNA polymerase n=1 Tax=Neolewinella lacunae TaxID=1517758 RepID=A0A923PJY1_9BACT|nr:DNA polymerase III subunit alpha [Neolewinella lacunae]MBC6993091.1 DNA polymerase III subunit alpha [Neolewinella lacunae]MDN3635911.1 DNA polymerase III subunit alpha [Neolewinella lacunae]
MHLNCHTAFSLRYGVLTPEALVAKAAAWGVSTLALADANNTSCAVEFVARCRRAGIKPILGVSFWREGQWLYTGLAHNAEGWRSLCAFLSQHSLAGRALPAVPPPLPDTWIIYPRLCKPIADFGPNELLGIRPQHVNRLFSHELRHHQEKLVVLAPVVAINDEDYARHKTLRAIDLGTVHTKLTPRDLAQPGDRLLPPATLAQFYKSYPAILANTQRIIDACTAELETGLSINRQTFTGSKDGDFALLEKLALAGVTRRYPPGSRFQKARLRTERELAVIRQQDFCSYFLITHDIVRYARAAGYQHVGRGSGANSIVAFCIGISDVDPLELDLYFERFINPFRASPPDFDIDFSWDERDDVIDYVFKRYGQDHTALLATYSTFRGRAALREVAKVHGLPKEEIDELVHDPHGRAAADPKAAAVLKIAAGIIGLPNHLSIHAGGIVITEKPIHYYTAQRLMPKGFPVAHCDMYHAEDLGLHKYDVLSQRGLGHLKSAVHLIRRNQGKAVDLYDLDRIKTDERVKQMLREGRALGCFYIESPAMRALLTKLRCDNYVHLVAASSIIRPGVAQSGMMKEYIHRFHFPHSFRYLAPVFEEQLAETFGVMVYQEDVMKIVHHFAGLELDESDVLRRIMSGKKYDGDTFERLREKFFAGAQVRGHDLATAEEVWRQIESFSGYSFCKAHSASFAVESFQSLYLKAYYPLEFIVGVINNFGGFYATEFYVHEARMAGAAIHAPCINRSRYLTDLRGTDLFLGFVHVKGISEQLILRVLLERERGGGFQSLTDFCQRLEVESSQLELLIRVGAFRGTGRSKAELLWEKNAVFNPQAHWEATPELFPRSAPQQYFHLDLSPNHRTGHPLSAAQLDQAFDELELLGFPLCSPFLLVATPAAGVPLPYPGHVNRWGSPGRTKRLDAVADHGQLQLLAYFVCDKLVPTVKGERMSFGCWLDEDGHHFDTVHFPASLRQFPFAGRGVYRLAGRVTRDFGFPSLEVFTLERLPYLPDLRFT